jgi:drug/metabolite transporter (DMT)-like permease
MLNNLGFFSGALFLLAGAVLLYEGVSNADASQTAAILGGAMLFSIGSALMWTVLKNWWEWRREFRIYRNK